MRLRLTITLALSLVLLSAPAHAQLAIEDADETGVLNPVDFSWRAYLDRMDRFPDRIGIVRNANEGKAWIRGAAEQHDKDAVVLVGSDFDLGTLRKPDRERSGNELSYDMQVDSTKRLKCLYGYAAEKAGDHAVAQAIFEDCIARWNDVYSMIWLSEMYETGVAMPRDPVMATELLKRAAQAPEGTPYVGLAWFHYGVALCEGHGIRQDVAEGRRYLAMAARDNIKEADEYLTRLNQ